MLSLLGRQRQLLGARFSERYPSNWLVWEQLVGSQGALLKNASSIVAGDVRMTVYEPEGFLQRLEPRGAKVIPLKPVAR